MKPIYFNSFDSCGYAFTRFQEFIQSIEHEGKSYDLWLGDDYLVVVKGNHPGDIMISPRSNNHQCLEIFQIFNTLLELRGEEKS